MERAMRVRFLKATENVPDHPSPGDICIGCVHKPEPDGCHYFYLGTSGITFKSPNGRSGTASWMLLCDACFIKHAGTMKEDINDGRVQIGCDMVWPDDLRVNFLRPS